MTRRILLVDDNPADLELVRIAFLERGANVDLVTATNGPEALDHLRRVARGEEPAPQVIVLDVNMPGLTGHDTLANARREHLVEDTPVVMLSTSAAPWDRQRAAALGATAYYVKPHRFDHLIEMLGEIEALAS